MKTIVAISERGRLVGTYEPPPPGQEASASILPGKGQKLHELEVDEALLARGREKELLRVLKRRFRLK